MTDQPGRYAQHHLTADRILDILARHPTPKHHITVTPEHMPTDWHTHILTLVLNHQDDTTPSIQQLAPHLDRDSIIRLIALPLGHHTDLPQLQAQLVDLARRRNTALALAHAAEAVNRGADPDTVLAQLTQGAA